MTPRETKAPEPLRLRARRPTVMRLSRRAVIVMIAAGAIAVVGALAYALTTSRAPREVAPVYNVGGQPPEKVRALPVDYRTRLGPPLPGDLGRPLLAAGVSPPPIGEGAVSTLPEALPPPPAAGPRSTSDQAAARGSGLFVAGAQVRHATVAAMAPSSRAAEAPPPGTPQRSEDRSTSPERLRSPASPFVVQTGAVITAALVTGVRSDLPGQVIGQITQNVYDTPSGRHLLIPQGAKVVGRYDSRIANGQRRVLLAWTRLILPNGRSLQLDDLPGADPAGYSGLEDRVDRHWSHLFAMAALSTVLGVGAELGADDDDHAVIRAFRRGASDTFNDVGRQTVGKGLDLAPTLTVRPGAPVRVIVTRDLILEPYESPLP